MINTSILEKAGLTRIEAKVYTSLLDLGPSLAGSISNHSGVHRRTIYDALDRLSKKGLISYIIKNNRKYFQCSNPSRFLEIIKEEENEVSTLMPELNSLFTKTKTKEETLFYKGIEGLKTAFEDQLSEGKEILVIGASHHASDILRFYFRWYGKTRKQKKIKMRIIASEETRGKMKVTLSQTRYMQNLGPAAINIYADKVSIVLWSKENPIAVIIKNKAIADSYRIFFEHMWNSAKK